MNIKFYACDLHACGIYRGELVAREINAQYPNHRMDVKTTIMFSDYAGTNIMVFQRQNKNIENINFAKSRGIVTIYEIDDDIWSIPAIFESYGKHCLKPDESMAVMRACDAITVTTPELADVVRKHIPGKQVFEIANALDVVVWDAAYVERLGAPKKDTVTIGWMASQSHLMDVPLVGEVLRDLMAEFSQLRLHFIGWIDMAAFMGNMLAPFKDRIKCEDWVPVSALADSMKGFDIGLLPLSDHAWNMSKSELKYFQYGALGIASVASPMPCYNRAIEPGAGLIAANNSPAEWYNHLKSLIANEELRRGMGARARQVVSQKHNIKDQVRVWVDTYTRIVNSI